ncbi:uncharacterized protein LOC143041696 [Oratosquilla oratoria]|uniref:uncharacterized protein LOC143022519 n=1 Tax=Oratosquilla oratoria TaxID=337810 RepID=UPI003F767823
MDYTGPATLADLQMDLALSEEEEDTNIEHWPPLMPSSNQCSPVSIVPSTPDGSRQAYVAATSGKRHMDDNSDNGSELHAPAAKTPKPAPIPNSPRTDKKPSPSLTLPSRQHTAAPQPTPPAFAPRADYVKLVFRENPSVETKLRWLAEVSKTFQLQRNLAEVKMAAVTSRYVYIARCRQDIVEQVTAGEFLSLILDVQDSPERPRKYPNYLITRYPTNVDPSLSLELSGVHSARRFRQNGVPINRIAVTWNLTDPPPTTVSFSFLPCLPDCEILKIKNDTPTCYRCWQVGHISRYCHATEKCAWCADTHDSRTCLHRSPPPPPDSTLAVGTSQPPSQPAPTNTHWKCPRCNKQGVNVWHGCARRPVTQSAPPPPPPPISTLNIPIVRASSATSESDQIIELRKAVATLMSRCKSLEERYDTFETRIIDLATKQDSTDTILTTLVEGQKAMIATVSSIDTKFNALTSHLNTTNQKPLPRSPSSNGVQHASLRPTATSHLDTSNQKPLSRSPPSNGVQHASLRPTATSTHSSRKVKGNLQ